MWWFYVDAAIDANPVAPKVNFEPQTLQFETDLRAVRNLDLWMHLDWVAFCVRVNDGRKLISFIDWINFAHFMDWKCKNWQYLEANDGNITASCNRELSI